MGQPVHAMVFASSEGEGLDACAAALAELRGVERGLTLFDDASDACELNRHAGRAAMGWTRISGPYLQAAEELSPCDGRSVQCGDRTPDARVGLPSPADDRAHCDGNGEARDAVGAAVVALDGDQARLPNTQTQLDFGGIGVGYGIDRALALLRGRGIRSALIDVSGDIGALGAPPGQSGWPVEIADPDHPGKTVAATRLCESALATSGNSESVVRYGARILGHVLNPATGWPAHALRQATVVARSALAADALSTAMLRFRTPAARRCRGIRGLLGIGRQTSDVRMSPSRHGTSDV